MKMLSFAIMVFLVSGCNPFEFAKPDSERIVTSGWAKSPPEKKVIPLYCYRTLGDPECYASPLDKGHERLIGTYESGGSANLP